MPKKAHRHFHYSYKPAYQAPATNGAQSLSLSQANKQSATGGKSSSSSSQPGSVGSVNHELERLRKTRLFIPGRDHNAGEGSSTPSCAAGLLISPSRTMHPSLQAILNDNSAPYIPPRPRNQRGFIAPDSWRAAALNRQHRSEAPDSNTVADFTGLTIPGAAIGPRLTTLLDGDELSLMPGLRMDRSSLLSKTLESMADKFEFHVEYDRDYLWMLRGGLKSMLLAFIANRVIRDGGDNEKGSILTAQSLRVLFERRKEDESDHHATTEPVGTEDVWHLDLSSALGRGLDFKDLNALFRPPAAATQTNGVSATTPQKPTSSSSNTTPPQVATNVLPIFNSWEEELDSLSLSSTSTPIPAPTLLTTTMFPNLTHLSLAYPKNTESLFPSLQKFTAKYVPTITHLSLAGWQTSISSNSGLASRQVVLEHFASCFRRLSRSLICLQYLDVSDCNRVVYQSLQGVEEWNGCWRGVVTVVVRQSAVAVGDGVAAEVEMEEVRTLRVAEAAALEETVKRQRRDGRGVWCRFVT